MSKRILIEIDLDHFKEIIRDAVREELGTIRRNQNYQTLTKKEACQRLGIGYKKLLSLTMHGDIAITPDGRIPARSIEEYLSASQKEI